VRVAITVKQPLLDANVDSRFGRCSWFLIVETNSLQSEALENPFCSVSADAGIRSAGLVVERGVALVLTGHCGANAHRALTEAGIGVIAECSGTARDAIEQFREGRLAVTDKPTVASHFGTSPSLGELVDRYPPPSQQSARTTKRRRGRRGNGKGRSREKGMKRGPRRRPEWPPAPIPPECREPTRYQDGGQELELPKHRSEATGDQTTESRKPAHDPGEEA
jgi:predicted Fe-Mo cluster-binding NifX family protein